MPQVDVEWPSEDEDFDAVADSAKGSKTVATATKEPEAEVQAVDEAPAEPEAEEAAPEPAATAPEPAVTEPEPAVVADQPPAKVAKPKSSNSGNRSGMLRMAGEAVLLLAVIGLGLWAWNLSSENKNLKAQVASVTANPQAIVQKQTDTLIKSVGQLIALPTGETPTIANVTDASQAKKQSAFFTNAVNGDKVLMYVKAGEAILYRPSTQKIILVAPLTFTSNSTTSTTTPAATTTTKK